jgi:hypothetical protein
MKSIFSRFAIVDGLQRILLKVEVNVGPRRCIPEQGLAKLVGPTTGVAELRIQAIIWQEIVDDVG